jgi:hypothetical protein
MPGENEDRDAEAEGWGNRRAGGPDYRGEKWPSRRLLCTLRGPKRPVFGQLT